MTDLERISINSDANSLCSEPVKMYDYNDFQNDNNDRINKSQVNLDDLFDFCNKNTTMSLGDLCSKELTGRDTTTSEHDPSRSDSPILEGIDQELAKYAKLKDLEQAYHSPTNTNHLLRNPDGASNPDLNSNKVGSIQLCRRSPGNGRSGSEPEEEGESQRSPAPVQGTRLMTSDGQSMSSGDGSSSVPSKSSPSGCSSSDVSSGSSNGGQQPQSQPQATTHRYAFNIFRFIVIMRLILMNEIHTIFSKTF